MIHRCRTIAATACVLQCLASGPAAAGEPSAGAGHSSPHYREIQFHAHQADYFPAIAKLLAAQARGRLDRPPDELALLLGELTAAYGQRDEATRILESIVIGGADPAIRDRARLRLAGIRFRAGFPADTERLLAAIGAGLAIGLESERQALLAGLHIQRGEFGPAISALQSWPGPDPRISYARYNLGVALARNGRIADAANVLEALGRLTGEGQEILALRDKANLALGYAYLRDGQPDAARLALKRVRLTGPFSNRALLGLGWAESEIDGYRRALVPWNELQGRAQSDPAVQQSRLAIPYALAMLDSHGQAADRYLSAIEAFDEERRRIELAVEEIRGGGLTSALLRYESMSGAGRSEARQEWRQLYPLLSTNEFQARLNDLRELGALTKNLDGWRRSVDVFQDMLGRRRAAYERRLPLVEEALSARRFEDLVAQKLAFDRRLGDIESSGDSLALATRHELETWHATTEVAGHPALSEPLDEVDAVLGKVDLLKGVLRWTLDKSFDERLMVARQHVAETGQALADAERLRATIDAAMQREKRLLADFSARLAVLAPAIDELGARVASARMRQRALLEQSAVDELLARKSRLDDFQVQARFALAAIYEIAARDELPSPGGARQ